VETLRFRAASNGIERKIALFCLLKSDYAGAPKLFDEDNSQY